MAASLSAKTTLAGSAALSAFIVWGVHYLQIRERHASLRSSAATVKKADGIRSQTMYQGVVRDEARQAAKAEQRAARAAEFEEQARRQRTVALTAHRAMLTVMFQSTSKAYNLSHHPLLHYHHCHQVLNQYKKARRPILRAARHAAKLRCDAKATPSTPSCLLAIARWLSSHSCALISYQRQLRLQRALLPVKPP